MFRPLQGAEVLSDYQASPSLRPVGNVHQFFCGRCGVRSFTRAWLESLAANSTRLNIACLDDATDEELAQAPVQYEDGRNDNWKSPPAEQPGR